MNWHKLYNPLISLLLRSPLHGLLSNSMMLLTFRGRRSGRTYTTPVSYVRDGDTLTTISLTHRAWWRNLRGGDPVTLRLQGGERQGLPQVVEDAEAVAEGLAALFRQRPAYARFLGVALAPDGTPDPDQLRRAAEGRVLVRITLK